MKAKYTIKVSTSDLICPEGGEKLFAEEGHGPFTGILILGFTEDGAKQIIHDTNNVEIAAAIASSEELTRVATLAAMLKGGKGGLLGGLFGGGED